jgi:hypothetical protein
VIRIRSWVVGFGRFWYGFVIGEDWVGALGVAVLLAGTWALRRLDAAAYWFGPAVVVVTALLLVRRGLRRRARVG